MNADEVSGMLGEAFDEIRFQVREQMVQAQERLESEVQAERERCAKVIQDHIDQWPGTSAEQIFKEMQMRIRSGK